MRPADVLAYKAALVQQLPMHHGGKGHLTHMSASTGETAIELSQFLPDASAYFVSADMAAIASHAAKSMPDQAFRSDDPPARTGWMMFDAPIARFQSEDETYPITATAWPVWRTPIFNGPDGFGTVRDKGTPEGAADEGEKPPDRICDVLEVYLCASIRDTLVPVADVHLEEGDSWGEESRVHVDRSEQEYFDHDPYAVVRAAWSIMQQSVLTRRSIAQLDDTKVDRPTRRRMARLHLPSALIIVRLRRLEHPESDLPPEKVDWSHRWLATGHWRNQWLPSINAHRLQWINPYVKGPNDRPLVLKNRVTAWVR
jgi:hypothetical protein